MTPAERLAAARAELTTNPKEMDIAQPCQSVKRDSTYGPLKCWVAGEHPVDDRGRPYHWAKVRNYDGHGGVLHFQWTVTA